MKVNLIFPGQGSQYVGMFNSFSSSEFQKTFDDADNALGFSIKNLCLEGPEDQLKLTAYTQPAIVTHSIATFKILKKILDSKNIEINSVLGHSVGEYSALVAAGSIDFKDALRAVNQRGTFMQRLLQMEWVKCMQSLEFQVRQSKKPALKLVLMSAKSCQLITMSLGKL